LPTLLAAAHATGRIGWSWLFRKSA